MKTTVLFWTSGGGDDLEVGAWFVRHECPHYDVEANLRKAIDEYLSTDEGQAQIAGSVFNWGDAVNDVPAEIWQKYGITSIDDIESNGEIQVEHDEDLGENKQNEMANL